jgi:hypothetical protein
MGASLSLGKLQSLVMPAINASEAALASALSNISTGDTVSNSDLVFYQLELAKDGLTGNLSSSIADNRKKALESVLQHI